MRGLLRAEQDPARARKLWWGGAIEGSSSSSSRIKCIRRLKDTHSNNSRKLDIKKPGYEQEKMRETGPKVLSIFTAIRRP